MLDLLAGGTELRCGTRGRIERSIGPVRESNHVGLALGGRITTAVLRDATHWDDVVTRLGYEHLRRHDLRHTGLTWMAAPGFPCTCCGSSPGTARC